LIKNLIIIAKDKDRYLKELNKEFSEITNPTDSVQKNLKEVTQYAEEEISSAET
jgi:hypothetical protein